MRNAAHRLTPARYVRRASWRGRLDGKARAAGFRDLADLLRHTAAASREQVAATLGCTRRTMAHIAAAFTDLPTRSEQDAATMRSAAASRAQAGKRERARRGYDELARACGYPGIDAMVDATRHLAYQQLADTLGIPAHRVQFLRRRYGTTT